jgi:putative transposase
VVEIPEKVYREIGLPQDDWCRPGPEFISKDLDLRRITEAPLSTSPGQEPTDNAFIESLNGKFRVECLNAHWFVGLDDMHRKCEDWHRDQNEVRPHSAIGNITPISLMNCSEAHGPV